MSLATKTLLRKSAEYEGVLFSNDLLASDVNSARQNQVCDLIIKFFARMCLKQTLE